jgi:pSer/pThr/pTyr-binding forkhead associated (FHA) protein
MARLIIKSEGFGDQVIELKLGVNRFGRSSENDFRIDHPTVSARHCELVLANDGLSVRDCDSTNGTFVEGKRTRTGTLEAGQTLAIGDVEFAVETTEVRISIPQFDVPRPAPPVVLPDGALICPRHPRYRATHQCNNCLEVLCDKCVHRLRRRGGKILKLCPICSHVCTPLGGEKPKKKSLLGFFQKTVKLPFIRIRKDAGE